VLVSEPNPRRRALLARLGLEAVDPVGDDLVEACLARTDGAGMGVAIECAGTQTAVAGALAAVRRGGTVVVAASHVHPPTVDLADLMLNGKRLLGSVGYEPDAWPRLLARIADGALPVERLVGPPVTLEAAVEEGFERLLDPGTDQVKVLVAMRSGAPDA
jgi:(R,R)-butanediol dehydrogenase/meso-butanediol dehydrogenase/diacetyl reductase